MEQQEKTLYSINGNPFTMPNVVEDIESDISVLAPGYIFTPCGTLIAIKESDIHDHICCNYMSKYLEQQQEALKPNDGIKILNRNNHVVNVGIRLQDVRYGTDRLTNFIFTPAIEKITPEQYEAIRHLDNANIHPRTKEKILNLLVGSFDKPKRELQPIEEFFSLYEEIKGKSR